MRILSYCSMLPASNSTGARRCRSSRAEHRTAQHQALGRFIPQRTSALTASQLTLNAKPHRTVKPDRSVSSPAAGTAPQHVPCCSFQGRPSEAARSNRDHGKLYATLRRNTSGFGLARAVLRMASGTRARGRLASRGGPLGRPPPGFSAGRGPESTGSLGPRRRSGRVRSALSRGRRAGEERRKAGRPAAGGMEGSAPGRGRPTNDREGSLFRRPEGERGGPAGGTHRAPLGADGGRHAASLGPSFRPVGPPRRSR